MKTMKHVLALLLALTLVCTLLAGCGTKKIETDPATQTGTQSESGEKAVKIGLIVGTGGLGDQNFNDLAYNGLLEAQKLYGIEFDYSEPQSASDYASYITQYAEDGSYDLIMLNASEAESALEELAPKYPDQKFSIIDTMVDCENVMSIVKDFRDYPFLGGYLAGIMTTHPALQNANPEANVGISLGVDSELFQSGALGYKAGAMLANPETVVQVGIVGSFADPATAKESAKMMYDNGADIIMNLNGGSSLGVFNQAEESNLYSIGVATNQNPIAPDAIIGSCTENLGGAVVDICKQLIDGTWKGGVMEVSISTGYFDIVYDGSNLEIPQDVKDAVAAVRDAVKDGTLTLPTSEDELEGWVAEHSNFRYTK